MLSLAAEVTFSSSGLVTSHKTSSPYFGSWFIKRLGSFCGFYVLNLLIFGGSVFKNDLNPKQPLSEKLTLVGSSSVQQYVQ